MTTETRRAVTLEPGETYKRGTVRVTILREREPCRDRFGRELFRYWARRDDTNAEGWVTFGETGVVATCNEDGTL